MRLFRRLRYWLQASRHQAELSEEVEFHRAMLNDAPSLGNTTRAREDARAVWIWQQANFGVLPSTEENLRRLIPAATLVVLGIQGIFSSFFMSTLGLKTAARKPPGV